MNLLFGKEVKSIRKVTNLFQQNNKFPRKNYRSRSHTNKQPIAKFSSVKAKYAKQNSKQDIIFEGFCIYANLEQFLLSNNRQK